MIGHPNSEAEERKIQTDTGLFVDWVLLKKNKIMVWKANLLMWTLQHDEVLHWTEYESHELHADSAFISLYVCVFILSFLYICLGLYVCSFCLFVCLFASLSLSHAHMHALTHTRTHACTHTHTHTHTHTQAQQRHRIKTQFAWIQKLVVRQTVKSQAYFPGNTNIAYKI